MGVLWEARAVFRSEHLRSHPAFGGVRIAQHFSSSVLCFFPLFIFITCLVYPMLPVFLDCPFLIVPSFFSKVY